MKRIKKPIAIIALALILTMICTGCGALSLASSIFKKKEPATSVPVNPATTNVNAPVADNSLPSDAIIAVTPSDSSVPGSSSQSTSGSANSSTSSTTAPASGTSSTTIKSPISTNSTTKPAQTQAETTEVDLSNLSVKSIQDMLFNTTDPNVAGRILTFAGFDYDEKQGIYYSTMDPLQRYFGYNIIYDIAAPRTGMIYSTTRIFFDYNNKNWMMQLWKGQYGITAGAEIGLYNKPTDRVLAQYDCASDDELITMKFDFYNNGKYVFTRGPEKHWWLTGFKIFNAGIGILIDLDITLEFPNRAMSDAFEAGLKKTAATELVDRVKYTRKANTFNIKW